MSMTQADKDTLQQNWQQAKPQIQSQFSGVTESDLQVGQTDVDQLVSNISDRTDQSKTAVEKSLKDIAQQYN